MTTQEMLKMRIDGATYQEIADACGISRQAAHERITNYAERMANGIRGQRFSLYDIKNKAIREHFQKDPNENISRFATKVGIYPPTMRNFLTGKNESYFTIAQVQRMCEVVGKSFEEMFGDGKDDGNE